MRVRKYFFPIRFSRRPDPLALAMFFLRLRINVAVEVVLANPRLPPFSALMEIPGAHVSRSPFLAYAINAGAWQSRHPCRIERPGWRACVDVVHLRSARLAGQPSGTAALSSVRHRVALDGDHDRLRRVRHR